WWKTRAATARGATSTASPARRMKRQTNERDARQSGAGPVARDPRHAWPRAGGHRRSAAARWRPGGTIRLGVIASGPAGRTAGAHRAPAWPHRRAGTLGRQGRPTMRMSRTERDQLIISIWEMIEDAEPDISTERLMAMVENDTGADYHRIIEALERA